MYDHLAHVMWQQHDRRVTAAAERRRQNLEAVERSRAEAESHIDPEGVGDAAAQPLHAAPQLATSVSR